MAVVSLLFSSFLSSVISLLKLALSPLLRIFFSPTLKEIPKLLQHQPRRQDVRQERSAPSHTHKSFIDVFTDVADDVGVGALSNDGI